MDTDDIFDGGLLKGVARIFLAFLRALLFIGWDLLFEVVGWTIGWPIYRALSFGRFPKEHIRNHEGAAWFTCLVVDLTGLAILVIVIAWISPYA